MAGFSHFAPFNRAPTSRASQGAMLAHALGSPLEKSFAFGLDFGSLCPLSVQDGIWQLHGMNC